MDYRTYKKNGWDISRLGFGLMRLPTIDGNAACIDEEKACAMVAEAFEAGVNYFDTAWFYHGGNAEAFAAKALAPFPRESYHLTTKLPMSKVDSYERAVEIFEEQFKRCNTDYFDFYLLHAMKDSYYGKMVDMKLYEMLDAHRKAGRIKNLGFSFHDTPEVLVKILDVGEWDVVQLQLNYLDWDMQRAKECYAILEERGIPCIVMEPVRGGRLADLGPEANALLKGHSPEASIASWALRWVAQLPNVLCILSGMSNPEQVRDNLATMSNPQPFTAEEEALLQQAIEVFRKYAIAPCTACSYCMPCPSGVNIPEMIALYNKVVFDGGNYELKAHLYPKYPAEENASNCVACGKCEDACPQKINISELMGIIHKRATT